ncbi:MotE family protein [Roseovarius sp. D22-M7]|uniref:MotE family protein n=1 Tax=Roseovarius sp. D22-M7 TaxID=3127116 RepID=UPI00300FECA6
MTAIRTRPRRPRRRLRGALVMIATMLLASAFVRLGNGVGQAVALASAEAVTGSDAPDAPDANRSCETPQDLQILLDALQDRAARLDVDEAAMQDRMQALRIADREVTQKLAALESAESSLRQTLTIAESAAEEDINRLTQVYERMKPKQAAALFEQMDPSFATGFLARMRPDAAAAIMAGLSPQAAHTFSVVLAGRNADVPTK